MEHLVLVAVDAHVRVGHREPGALPERAEEVEAAVAAPHVVEEDEEHVHVAEVARVLLRQPGDDWEAAAAAVLSQRGSSGMVAAASTSATSGRGLTISTPACSHPETARTWPGIPDASGSTAACRT